MKKVICLLLTLLACLVLVNVASAETTVPTTCAAGCENPDWKPLPSNWRTLKEGHYHYYLTKNISQYLLTPNPKSPSSSDSGAKLTICLDLNGFHNEIGGRAMGIYTGNTINIMDSSAGKTGYIQGSTGNNNPSGGTMFLYGTLNVYSGTLKFKKLNTGYGCGAGCIANISSGGVLNMYGGRIEGGETVISTYDLPKNGYGGTLVVSNGKVNVYGGEIVSGSVPASGEGPCIYVYGTSSSVTLSGNGNVENICLGSSAKINVSGTYSGTARITCGKGVTPAANKVLGTATNTPKITGDLFCTNGDGWMLKTESGSLKLGTFTPNSEWHYCEHCKEIRRWTAMNSSNYTNPKNISGSYHYYLSSDQKLYFLVGNESAKNVNSTVCLDLYGKTLAPASGRALLLYGGSTLNLMDTKGGGSAVGSSGNINNPRGGTITIPGKSTLNMYSGTLKYNYIEGATSSTYNGVVAVGGTLNLYGGRIEGTTMINHTSGIGGAAIHMYNTTSVLNLSGGEVISGTVPAKDKGPCIYVPDGPTVKLSGDAKADNIYFKSNQKKLTVSGDYTGIASITYGTVPELGAEVGTADNARILGALTCTNGDWLIKAEGTKLVTTINAPVTIIDGEKETGYETLQAAVNAYEGGCIKLSKSLTENIAVSKNLTLDLNGCSITGTVTVAEGATLYCKDKQTDDYTVADGIYGQLTVTGNATGAEGYLAITEDGKVSFHKYTVKITDMTLRPAEAGIYYKSSFLGDEKIAPLVESFGVALSLHEVPNAQNMDIACSYTVFTDFQSGAAGNASSSSLLKGILKTNYSEKTNTENLNITIYGRPYLKTVDGYLFGEAKNRTLTQQLQDVDTTFAKLSNSQRYALMNMYNTFHAVLKTADLPNMAQEKTDDEETLSILMVGNSFCYYYVEELYGLLMANPDPNRGYKNVEVVNVYYSGCSLTKHYNWWVAGEANYDVYKTNANGRNKLTPATGTAWSLEDSLMISNWDYISLQGASSENNYSGATTEENVAKMIPLATPLLGRFHELFPKAQLLWHRTWAFEVGRKSGSTVYNEDLLARYDAGMQAVCDWMCNEFDKDKPYDLKIVNSGAAWTIAREENAKLETSLIPVEGGLCARLGIRNESTYPYYTGNNNAGDGYHDGDIGGAQFLNACVWYETITGQSVLENDYKPTTANGKYALSDDFANLLRNAAHAATK